MNLKIFFYLYAKSTTRSEKSRDTVPLKSIYVAYLEDMAQEEHSWNSLLIRELNGTSAYKYFN
jgi:hypothetical protein